MVATSNRVHLTYPLIHEGIYTTPGSKEQFQELFHLFPTTYAVDICPPVLIIRVNTLPPRPWPLTVGGMLLRLTSDQHDMCFDRGFIGKGPRAVTEIDLRDVEFSDAILSKAIYLFTHTLRIGITSIAWMGTSWMITVPDGTKPDHLPFLLAGLLCNYKYVTDTPRPELAALRAITSSGTVYDTTKYVTAPNAVLRPGIMISSANLDGEFGGHHLRATSGIAIANAASKLFITIPSHCVNLFEKVYHPEPNSGNILGTVVDKLGDTDVSIVQLNSGLRYVNETFSTKNGEDGVLINGINPGYPPDLRIGDSLSMNNPYSGFCEGIVFGIGGLVEGFGKDSKWIRHQWSAFEEGGEPIQGSCGSAILDDQNRLVSFFRFQELDGRAVSVSATVLREYSYEICGGVQTF